MSVETTFISIPLFQKDDPFSIEFPREGAADFPTLEHYLWHIIGFPVKPDSTSQYLRTRIRTKLSSISPLLQAWDQSLENQELFKKAWMSQIMERESSKNALSQYVEKMKQGNDVVFQCTIPKNKSSLYRFWAWNPDTADQCQNRLGILFHSMVKSILGQERSTSTTRKETPTQTTMIEHTFCPDCESLLFIQQKKSGSSHILHKCCNICGWQKEMGEDEMKEPIYVTKGRKQHFKITDYDISEILMDPTLPRINNIPCVNPICPTNHLVEEEYGFLLETIDDPSLRDRITSQERAETLGEKGAILYADTEESLRERIRSFGLSEESGSIMKGPVERHIVYYRTNPNDLSYSYICSTCKTIWSNHS